MTLRNITLAAAATILATATAFGQAKPAAKAAPIRGTLQLSDGSTRNGEIRWSAKEKAYVTQKKVGATMMEETTPPEQVEAMDIEKPAQ